MAGFSLKLSISGVWAGQLPTCPSKLPTAAPPRLARTSGVELSASGLALSPTLAALGIIFIPISPAQPQRRDLACKQSEIPEVTQVRRPQGCMRRGGVRDSTRSTSVIERGGT